MVEAPSARIVTRLRRHPSARIGGVLLLALVSFAVLGPLIASADPLTSDFVHGFTPDGLPAPPGGHHLLGTDSVFRDVLSRLGGKVLPLL